MNVDLIDMHVAPFRLALSQVQFRRVCCGYRYYGEVMKIMLVSQCMDGNTKITCVASLDQH